MISRAWMASVLASLVLLGCGGMQYGLRPEPVAFEMGQPMLRWEAFPTAADLEADDQGVLVRAQDVCYDLRVYRPNGALLLERRGIPDTRFLVVLELRPGEYRWTVRPRFTVDGHTRIGQWSLQPKGRFENAILPVPVESYPSFRVGARR
ncbi:MAG: hypothetical protein KDB80_08615 [Planctomycetes bacterium]|nr:hypothetical protein [Planctomycetota bacterium]